MSIYKIYREGDEDNYYIGSTNNFNKRKTCHKAKCKTRTHKLYNYINENGGWDNFKMEVLEYCLNYQEREIELIKQLKPPLNSNLYDYNEKEYQKKYREENKDKFNEWSKKWYEGNKEYQKKWVEENKDKVLKNKNTYREKNKDKLNSSNLNRYHYISSWGGDVRRHNNLLKISIDLFD